MDNYKPNSRLSKRVEKEGNVNKEKVEKIIKGTVKSKKKSGLAKLFLSDDAVDVKSYVVFEVLIPGIKAAISDIVTNGIDMLLYGETSKGRKSSSKSSRISYRSYYDREDRNRDRYRRNTGYSYDDIILETSAEANDVINRLEELIDVYEMASVADLYDLVGISGQYTDNNYGWTDLRSATYSPVRGGYLLKLPRAIPLK